MQGGRRDNWITIQIINFLIFGISVQAGKPNITLCRDVPSTWSNISTPEVVVLREHNLDDIRMTSALDDVECWIQKKFHVANQEVVRVETKGDNETICYAISTVDVKRGQMIVVISEGQSAQNCTPNIYGPLPNVLNIKMFIDGSKNSSVRRMEISFQKPGGHLGVQFEFHRSTVVSKIQKTIRFFFELNSENSEYSELVSGNFWTPKIRLPPATWQFQKIMEKMDQTIPWWVILSVMPMVFFGISVSCYLVIQPRGGLTYTDEEVDFQIQEVDSASRVNVIQPPAPLQNLSFKTAQALPRTSSKTTTSSSESDDVEPPMRTAKEETENHPKTAISGEIPEKMNTAISEKSTKTMRLSATVTNTTAGNSAETISLKTGRD
ncbi:hypothetical protein L3Y34_016962 [Caenorhabditis briggsae]|uniref:Uncharacterized protein n=1 Tax=Caenorhabditis briggsae TaxID=6238 RepID=A0AAE9ISL7_CAEBR|nr:hypothetical protein L3Y34_016962 [Caenorhabditis briggsae]